MQPGSPPSHRSPPTRARAAPRAGSGTSTGPRPGVPAPDVRAWTPRQVRRTWASAVRTRTRTATPAPAAPPAPRRSVVALAAGRHRRSWPAPPWRRTRPRWPTTEPAGCACAAAAPEVRDACDAAGVHRQAPRLDPGERVGDRHVETHPESRRRTTSDDGRDVRLEVAAVPALEALRPRESVALLPHPKRGGAQSGALSEVTDGERADPSPPSCADPSTLCSC